MGEAMPIAHHQQEGEEQEDEISSQRILQANTHAVLLLLLLKLKLLQMLWLLCHCNYCYHATKMGEYTEKHKLLMQMQVGKRGVRLPLVC
jgi:benzoyl-CoA reductase/2-hydroxyglutaryl-CoA dehydratase subunit BcrC/BadD/HgdB